MPPALSVSRQHRIREHAAKALFRTGVSRTLLRRPRQECVVLLYHNPEPEAFAAHLEFLARYYELRDSPGAAGHAPARPSVSITFDDAYRGVHRDILPLLQRAGVPATMFVPTGFLGRRFGYEALRLALLKTQRRSYTFDGRLFELSDPGLRKDAWLSLAATLKLLPAQARDQRIDAIIAELDVAPSDLDGAEVVSEDEVREMARYLEIGSHTVSHPNLARLDAAEIRRELVDSKAELERITGKPCRLFAYPIGRSDDYTSGAGPLLREAGYVKAFTAIPTTSPDSDFEYPRIGIGDRDSLETLCLKLSFIWRELFRLLA